MSGSLLQSTCLKPSYSLRQQLLLSFGSAALLTLLIVATVAAVCVSIAGNTVSSGAEDLLRDQVMRRLVHNIRFESQTLYSYMYSMEGAVQLVVELVQDRIVGYPDAGWEQDEFVPFFDRVTETNMYPLKSTPLRMDWDIDRNMNDSNIDEHLQERATGSREVVSFLSSLPSYFMQGVCDPNEIDASAPTYFANCSSANNDYLTGGVIAPSPTSKGLYEKAADLGVLLKPIYEASPDITSIGIYFFNSGAGSMVQYPGSMVTVTSRSYVSEGCDWMREINPYTGKPFGTDEDIARCHPAGTLVSAREYNAMERKWCRQVALDPSRDPFNVTESYRGLIAIARGVFDRRTGNFIACVGIHMYVKTLDDILQKSKIHQASDLSIVRYSDNTVLVDTLGSNDSSLLVTDTGLITKENLEKLRATIDFRNNLTPEEIQKTLVNNVVVCKTDGLYAAYPLPPPPPNNTDYEPRYLVIHAISNEVFAKCDSIKNKIDDEVLQISLLTFLTAAVGMLLIFAIVFFVSRGLTQPLLWIKRTAWGIVNHADERSDNSIRLADDDIPKAWLPSTEISELVVEFRKMIHCFSGEGPATIAGPVLFEISNKLTWQSDYMQIYSRSSAPTEKKTVLGLAQDDEVTSDNATADILGTDTPLKVQGKTESDAVHVASIVPAPPKQNYGMNILHASKDFEFKKGLRNQFGNRKMLAYRSALFWWILLLIVVPLVLTNVVICWIVSSHINETVDQWIDVAADESQQLELFALSSAASLKATEAQMNVNEVTRDLHVMTRFAGWLFFDGVSRSDAFPRMEEDAAQQCRGYEPGGAEQCPFFSDFEKAPCACEWKDLNQVACTDVNFTDPRSLQELFFICQARDYDNVTGTRDDASSFGLAGVDDSPNATIWWNDVEKVPGAQKGSKASGFGTTYDRIRVSSAMAVVDVPIYNYGNSMKEPKNVLATYVAFQGDGMLTGYHGCYHKQAFVSTFQSNEINQAYEIAPELCPKGKFGFDPRCRLWYSTGRSLYDDRGQPVYITAPYLFAVQNESAATATSPIVNPTTREYVGQTVFDYTPSKLRRLFDGLAERVAFVITPDDGVTGEDTVIGPGDFDGWKSVAISDLLFPFEEVDSMNRGAFNSGALMKMKTGMSGMESLSRTAADGSVEKLRLAFGPVNARVLLPLDPSDFSRGVNVSTILVYSVGIAFKEDEIQRPWEARADDLYSHLDSLRLIYLIVIGTVSALFIACACSITVTVTKPVITLLTIVRTINNGMVEDDIPPLHGGSREVHQVYNSFAKLYKIVRISNVAFFSGNLTWSYSFINDALKLFRKVGDLKATGIACNNLGNTLHAMCNDARYVGECCNTLPGICLLKTAHIHYNEAIDIAQRQLEEARNDEENVGFAQQLSDRLFNRGLFLLLVANDKCGPANSRQLGLSDIAKARQLDHDVRDFWVERKLLLKHSAEYFFRLIRRTLGLIEFDSDEGVRACWDASELVADADHFLFAAWDQPSAPLFQFISRVGRLQQLEGLAMLLDVRRGRSVEAVRLAMRMLVEDEHLIECCFRMSAIALLNVIRNEELSDTWTPKTKSSVIVDLRTMLRSCRQTNLDIGKNLVVALEISQRWEGDPLLEAINGNLLKLYDDCCLKDDYMGLVACTTQGDINVPLCVQAENEGLHRTSLDLATSSTSHISRPSFPYAIQMLIDSEVCSECDAFIVLLTDGSLWDSAAHAPLKAQIERMNNDREIKVHILILGMGVESDQVKEECKWMCTVTKKSAYIDIDATNVESAFDDVSAVLRGIQIRNVCSQGITMEKF